MLRVVEHPLVEAVAVRKSYGDRRALCDVDLTVRRGQLHGLLGPNGAGKTTLLRILLGLVRRDGGTVRLLGRDLERAPVRLADGVAGLIETPAFYPYLSAWDNLALLARLDDGGRCGRVKRIACALEESGLGAHADVAVGTYSAGMRQRLGVAAALLRLPRLLLLDEPTSSLDPAGARDVRAIAQRFARNGAAVVFSSHDMTEVEDLCTAVTIINGGRAIFSGTVDELRQRAPAPVHTLRTSDDAAAAAVASRHPRVRVGHAGGALEVAADLEALDAYTIALAHAGVAVRTLERRSRSLESLFLELTSTDGDAGMMQAAS